MAQRDAPRSESREHLYLAYTNRLLDLLGPANQPFARKFAQLRRNEGLNEKTVYHYVKSVDHFDKFLPGRPVVSVTEQEAMDFVSQLRAKVAEITAFHYVFYLRRYMRDALGVRELPLHLDQSLRVPATTVSAREARTSRSPMTGDSRMGYFVGLQASGGDELCVPSGCVTW